MIMFLGDLKVASRQPHQLHKSRFKNNSFYVSMGTKLDGANNKIGKHKVTR